MSVINKNQLDFPALMNEIFKPDWFGGIQNENHVFPAVNIKETEIDFQLELSVPGWQKEDFVIELDKEILTISSVKNPKEELGEFSRKEFSVASFKRSFTLPNSIAQDGIKANYENGILSLALPKKEEALPKPKRTIEMS